MDGFELKLKLAGGKRIYGTAIVSPSAVWPGVVSRAGLDFVFIDTEHIPLNRETVAHMCQQFKALGIPALVRTPSPSPYEATIALDGGAFGVLAPYVETEEQVLNLIGATKLRPLKGQRLENILHKTEELDETMKDYIKAHTRNNFLAINIESTPALERLDDLFRHPELDAAIIGPHDLSCSLGVPEQYTHPRFVEAVQTIIKKGQEHNVSVGIHLSKEPDHQVRWAKEGVNIILHSSDMALFSRALQNDIQFIKTELGEAAKAGDDDVPVV